MYSRMYGAVAYRSANFSESSTSKLARLKAIPMTTATTARISQRQRARTRAVSGSLRCRNSDCTTVAATSAHRCMR